MNASTDEHREITEPEQSAIMDLANVRKYMQDRTMTISLRALGSSRLNISMSKVQTFVGLTAGILSITGALAAFFGPAPNKGELVVMVEDARTQQTISDAKIEVVTPSGAVITTLKPSWSGKASSRLDEGSYKVRVQHPRYGLTVRDVQLISSHSTELRIELRAATSSSNPLRRLFRR